MVKPREQEEAKEGLIGVGALHLFSCPKGGTDSGWLQQKCLGFCLGLEGRARPQGAHGRAAGSLPFWTRPRWASPCLCRDGVQGRMVPDQP